MSDNSSLTKLVYYMVYFLPTVWATPRPVMGHFTFTFTFIIKECLDFVVVVVVVVVVVAIIHI